MRKVAVRYGDPTTTRGFVLACSSTIFDNGQQVALSGDEATCGECKGTYKILGTGEGMTEKNRSVVVDGDRVLCPCGKNHVIVGVNPGIFLEVNVGARPPSTLVSGQAASSSEKAHWISFTLSERASCEGLSCVAHFADGSSERGVVDSRNRVRFARSRNSVCRHVEFVLNKEVTSRAAVSDALLAALRY